MSENDRKNEKETKNRFARVQRAGRKETTPVWCGSGSSGPNADVGKLMNSAALIIVRSTRPRTGNELRASGVLGVSVRLEARQARLNGRRPKRSVSR